MPYRPPSRLALMMIRFINQAWLKSIIPMLRSNRKFRTGRGPLGPSGQATQNYAPQHGHSPTINNASMPRAMATP